jgi:hypothetical protein
MKRGVVVLVWVDVTVVSMVVLKVVMVSGIWAGAGVGAAGVGASPPPHAQHMSNAVKSGSSYPPAEEHHEGLDA